MGASASNAEQKASRKTAPGKPTYGDVTPTANLQSLSWASVGGDLVTHLIAWVNVAGDAITFATGAQGRWLSVTILTADGPVKRRFESTERAEQGCEELLHIAKERAA